jgi:hypothetical protein
MADQKIKSTSPTYIHGIGSSTAIDTASEIVDLAGLDCSSLVGGPFSWEHKNDQPNQLVGKILEYKKIFSEKDCENDSHKYFWNKCKVPYLYVMGRLFDDKKDSSKECAALFLDDAEHPDEQPMVGFSVEGSKISKVGMIVDKSIARRITVTNCPANKTCVAEIVKNPDAEKSSTDTDSIFKSEASFTIELMAKSEPLNKATTGIHGGKGSMSGHEKGVHPNLGAFGKQGAGTSAAGVAARESNEAKRDKFPGAAKDLMDETKGRHREVLGQMKGMSKPKLGKAEVPGSKFPSSQPSQAPSKAVQGAPGWNHTGGGNFQHPEHGVVSVVKEGSQFNVKHGGALAGVGGKKGSFGSAKEAGAHAGDYIRGLSQGKTSAPTMQNPSPGMAKAMSAGSGMCAPGALSGGAALGKESLDKKMRKAEWLARAEQAYQSWTKKEQFENFMAKHMPSLTKGEVSAIGQTLALRKSLRAESKLKKMITDQGQDSYVNKKE